LALIDQEIPMRQSLLLAAVVLPLYACTPAADEPAAPESAESAPAAPSLARFDPEVDALLAKMTLQEKVGQMTQADITHLVDEADIADYFLGSLLSGGSSDPEAGNEFEHWREMVERYQRRALTTRLGIPIVYGIDAVHGHGNVIGATVFPHNIGLGATRDADLVERVYRATAAEVRATGIHWSFAPCVAVPRDVRWGRTYEGFAEDPALVSELGAAAVRGFQGAGLGGGGLDDPESVLACAKHYVGDGGTAYGTGAPVATMPESVFVETGAPRLTGERFPFDRGDVQVDEATLRAIHLPPYEAAIEAGVGSIMASYSGWNGTRMSGHRYLLTEVLKGELGFEGFIVSDWASIDDLPGDYASDVVESINAGLDMVMVPDKYREFYGHLVEAAEAGQVPMERIDDAVRRILRVKHALGLFDEGFSPAADPALAERFGGAAHRELAREAVRRSLVLLKNDPAALPLSKQAGRIHVVGKNADDLGNQCGGWTIKWQGESGEITEGTTVLEAIRETVAEGTEVTHAADGSGAAGADVVVAVIGERPYAEMLGDREDLRLDDADVAAVRRAAEAGAPVVTVVISGRPMILGEVLDASAAVVAAWLPGSEGRGVADVLFGDHAPDGKLPFAWPFSMEQVGVHPDDEGYDPLFPYGFGMSY
jgi:beta-glucosidase